MLDLKHLLEHKDTVDKKQTKPDNLITGKATYNQDKRAEEFCQEFLDYSMFESAVVPHAAVSRLAGRCQNSEKWKPCDALTFGALYITSPPLSQHGHSASTIDPILQPWQPPSLFPPLPAQSLEQAEG